MNSPLEAWRKGDGAVRTFVALQVALAVISYVATTWGFIDLMKIDLLHQIEKGTLDGGDIVGTVIVVAIASAVVVTMLIGLSAMLDRDRSFVGRFVGGIVYAFFVFWSIAFGYGFFWKTLASEEFTRANFQRQTVEIQATIDGVMDNLRGVVTTTTDASVKAKALSEKESRKVDGGKTCTNNQDSIGDPGPLTTARANFAVKSGEVAKETGSWRGVLEKQAGDLAWRIEALDPGSDLVFDPKDLRAGRPQTAEDGVVLEEIKRRVSIGAEGRKLAYDDVKALANQFVRKANQLRRDVGGPAKEKLEGLATDMSVQGDRETKRFCLDTELAGEMTKAASSIGAIKEVAPIEFESVEGAEATRFAAMNLGRHAIQLIAGPFGYKTNEKELAPLSEEDIVALYATSAIDFALLMVSILARPRAKRKSPKGKPTPEEVIEQAKASAAEADAAATKDKGDLKVRQQQRDIREQAVKEDRADHAVIEQEIEIERQQRSLDRQRESGALLDTMTMVLGGDEILARAVMYALGDNIQEVNGEHYVGFTETNDSEHNQRLRRVSSYFSLDHGLGVYLVPPYDPAHEVFAKKTAEDGSPRKVLGLFRIEPRFGRNLLMVSVRPAGLTDAPQAAGAPQPEAPQPSAGDEPQFGPLDRAIHELGKFVPSKPQAAEPPGDEGQHPSTFGMGSPDDFEFTRNDKRDDPGMTKPDIEAQTSQGNGGSHGNGNGHDNGNGKAKGKKGGKEYKPKGPGFWSKILPGGGKGDTKAKGKQQRGES